MAEQVVSDLKELKNITSELKRMTAESRVLRLKKKEIEDRIISYLKQVDQPGVKYGDLIVLSKERMGRERLKNREKEENAISRLESLGIVNAKEALHSILDSMKGKEKLIESLQIKESRFQ